MTAVTRSHGLGTSVLAAIGGTPTVELRRLTGHLEGRILAKLEYLNPGGSKKDRIALQMIEDAEASGELTPDRPVVELTSGNTGTGLALVCAVKGYRFIAVMSRGNSVERARMMSALGAEVVLVDQAEGSSPGRVSGDDLALVEAAAQQIALDRNAYRANQFTLGGNVHAHQFGTGPELWEQAGGEIDAFCDFVGSGGTFTGIARALKGVSPSIACYVIEPEEAAILSGSRVTNSSHRIQGGGYAMPALTLLDHRLVDAYLQVGDEETIEMARTLAKEEGIFAGFSSAANIVAAVKLLETRHRGQTVAVILADSGMKYLSTDLWEGPEAVVSRALNDLKAAGRVPDGLPDLSTAEYPA